MGGSRKSKQKRDDGPFVALPNVVIDSEGFRSVGYAGRALLIDIARQYRGDNNGTLLASRAYMLQRGWNSSDVLARAKADLLRARLIHETFKGHRPNKASWYACTWWKLDRHPDYDAGAVESFVRGGYGPPAPPLQGSKLPRHELYARWRKSATPSPDTGPRGSATAPDSGHHMLVDGPESGTMEDAGAVGPAPDTGHHLEMPSAVPPEDATAPTRKPRRPRGG